VNEIDEQKKREGALKGLEVLSLPGEAKDIDPADWLGVEDGQMFGTVEVEGVRLKIAALTEAETQRLMKLSRRPDPAHPGDPPRLDPGHLRLLTIVTSLNKANPDKAQITPNQLSNKKTGVLTTLQEAIMQLSGMDTERRPSASFFD